MGRKLVGYKNRLWEVIHDFQYTGQTEEVIVPPGEYLLICHGAHGGTSQYQTICYGGSAMGIWNNTREQKLYVNVGGNGESYTDDKTKRNLGGFNGGGNGSLTYNTDYTTINTNYLPGAGGGGASDIRTVLESYDSTDDQTIPQEYKQVPYVECCGAGSFVKTDYIVTGDTCIECDCVVYSDARRKNNTLFGNFRSDNKRYLFSTRYADAAKPYFFYGNSFSNSTTDFTYNERIKIITDIKTASWYKGEDLIGSITVTTTYTPSVGNLYLFAGLTGEETHARIYAFKAFENGELKLDLVPCIWKEDRIAGFYDTVSQKFYGNSAYPKFQQNQLKAPSDSLNSRFIVAGGGAGSRNGTISKMYADYAGNGGGAVGGNVTTWTDETTEGKRVSSLYATQSSGYAFGIGMNAIDKFNSGSGYNYGYCDGGGGGGWFGGYTGLAGSETATGGGGGSGYVLTESSYKPEGYLLNEDFYLTDTFLGGGDAFEPQVLICKETTAVKTGDHIDFYCTGETTKLQLFSGIYDFMCYGGDGGVRYQQANTARGGQSGGRINIPALTSAYVTVGGSGIGTGLLSADYALMNRPIMMFNGGGSPSSMGKSAYTGMGGGGSTDIRIGSDSLYARVCVASGGGGEAAYLGGAGGGASGTSASSGLGTSPGPGTQTESPQNTSYPTINGGFGYGGNGVAASGGAGGAGGSGWYGGSGTQPDGSSDDDKGGNGGSGFVFTKDAIVPPGYLLNSDYYMTNAVNATILPGNSVWPIGHTKAEIDVVTANTSRFLCEDSEGYKYFSTAENKWVFLRSAEDGVLTDEDFDNHPQYEMLNINGLFSPYTIYVKQSEDIYDQLVVNVTPNKQTIHGTFKEDLNISNITTDFEYDTSIMKLDTNVSKHGIAEASTVDIGITITPVSAFDQPGKLYSIQIFSTGSTGKIIDYNPPQKEPIAGDKSLLPVGTGMKIPMKYRNYYTTLADGSPITSIQNCFVREKDRMIYIFTRMNKSTYTLHQFNMLTCAIDKLWEWSNSGSQTNYGDFLYDPDRHVIYLLNTINDVRSGDHVIAINIDTNETQQIWINPNNMIHYAYGKLEVYKERYILTTLTKYTNNKYTVGILITDPDTTQSKSIIYDGNGTPFPFGDYSVGKTTCIMTDYQMESSRKDVAMVCDIENQTWSFVTLQSGATAVTCYHDGKFYITQKNYLYIYDEETKTLEETIVTPWNTQNPYYITYGNGVLYVAIDNSPTLYVYDLKRKNFTSVGMRTSMPSSSSYGTPKNYRPCAFRGYYFIANTQLLAVNATNRNKYALGYKYTQYLFPLNKTHEANYTYDDRFITFTDSHARIHNGDLIYPLEVYDEKNLIKRATIDKKDYFEIIKFTLSKS